MAGAYGILRVSGLLRTSSGWGCNPRFFKPNIRSPVLLNKSPANPPTMAQHKTMMPPTIPVMTSAVSNCAGPIQAPIEAHSFTSPIPIPPIQQKNPKTRLPRPIPNRLWPMPCQPCTQPETATPATRNGRTSQFGMRQLRKSVSVAIARTIRVGHQAIERIYRFASLLRLVVDVRAILRPNRWRGKSS